MPFNCGFLPHLHLLRNKHCHYQTKLSLQGFQSIFTMSPVHEPSPSKGRCNTHDSKLGTQCWAHGMWTLCYLHPTIRFPSKASSNITISWYRVAAWSLTSNKSNKTCVISPERQCESVQHLPGTQLPNFDSRVESDFDSADSGQTLSMCTICAKFVSAQTTIKGH